ncbi:hypothetical protein Kurepalu1_00011 [Pseudomonas phage vB_PpuP-Kurepalu-1]
MPTVHHQQSIPSLAYSTGKADKPRFKLGDVVTLQEGRGFCMQPERKWLGFTATVVDIEHKFGHYTYHVSIWWRNSEHSDHVSEECMRKLL